ncbi:MAG: hypothetical protein H6822_04480 [Planctomycetaceae bacterium]|nr:hypothetical protein [Planctomycetales bacterium]MCB9921411.1 hypothetical protein [Planctomycetaceae bacterium]
MANRLNSYWAANVLQSNRWQRVRYVCWFVDGTAADGCVARPKRSNGRGNAVQTEAYSTL